MAKYSFKFKKKIVKEYLNGEGGYRYFCKKYCLSDKNMIKKWIKAYNTFGDDGLIRKISKQKYTFDFKFFVVKLYLTTEISYQDLALKIGINEPSLISRCINDFKIAGPDAFREKTNDGTQNA